MNKLQSTGHVKKRKHMQPYKKVPYHTHKEYWTKKDGERYFYNKFCNQMVCATELEYRHYTRLKTVSAISTLIALASIIIALLK